LAEVSVARELLGADGCGAGAGAVLICELLPAGGGCEPLDLLDPDFVPLEDAFELVLIEVVVAEAVRVLALAAGVCVVGEFPSGTAFFATVAAGFTGVGAGAGATDGALDRLLAGACSSGAVDSTISTGASDAAAARALVAVFAALTAAAAGRVYAGATVAVGAGAAADGAAAA